jgi:signal transduction histidine kinase/CheY-like chemotaxis protein
MRSGEQKMKIKVWIYLLSIAIIGILILETYQSIKDVTLIKDISTKHRRLNLTVSKMRNLMSLQRELRGAGYTILSFKQSSKKFLPIFKNTEKKIEKVKLSVFEDLKGCSNNPNMKGVIDILHTQVSNSQQLINAFNKNILTPSEWFSRWEQILDKEKEITALLLMPQTQVELIDYLSQMKKEVMDIANYIGLERTQIEVSIFQNQPIDLEILNILNQYRAVVDAYIKNILASKIIPSIPKEIISAIEIFDYKLRSVYEPKRQRIYAASVAGNPYPLDVNQWWLVSSEAVNSTHELNNTISKTINDNLLKIKEEAHHKLKMVILETTSILAIFIMLIWWLTNNLFSSFHKLEEKESQLSQYTSNLENTVNERTQQLIKAKEEAESSLKIKSNFLANMSHEIRTPMNSVIGFLSLSLEDKNLSTTVKKYITTAYNSSKLLLRIINDILDISKLESGKVEIDISKFNLPRLVREVLSTIEIKAHEKMLKLELDIHPSLFNCRLSDSSRLRQILLNLIGNAIKFTHEGSVIIAIEPTKEDDIVHFSVKDTGIGIPQERINLIREPFTQVDASTTRQFGGTGLGTSIAKQLVELLGGEMWIESELGVGSTFHFTIKMTSTECSSSCFSDCEEHGPAGEVILPQSPRSFDILIAEDIPANIELLSIRLNQQGHNITVTENGRLALEQYKKKNFDLILMDVQMPIMDGLEATRQIRLLELESGSHISIIALTASILKEDRKKCIDAGMDIVVGKPIEFNILFDTMEKIVPAERGMNQNKMRLDFNTDNSIVIPQIDGVDAELGLKTWQNKSVYIKTLLNFAKDYVNIADQLEILINKNKLEDAYHLTHSVKGIAGNLAVNKVTKVVTALDKLLKEKQISKTKPLLDELTREMHAFSSSIQILQEKKKNEIIKKEADPKQIKELLDQLRIALGKGDPDPAELVIEKLETFLDVNELQPIAEALDNFDFKKAMNLTHQLDEKLEIS